MLNLSVSTHGCIPGRDNPGPEPRPQRCAACGAPGGGNGELLEKHIGAKGKPLYLCPMCHACLHLDVAGRRNAGRVIWLPELTQEQLNLLCLAAFIAITRSGALAQLPDTAPRHATDVKPMVDHAVRLIRTFEKRAEPVETFLGGNVAQSLLPRHTLSSPTHVASLIVSAQRETKLDARTLARRLDGLRLLPNPRTYQQYVSKVSLLTSRQFAVQTWMPSVQDHLDALQVAQTRADEADAHFDAGEEAEIGAGAEVSDPITSE